MHEIWLDIKAEVEDFQWAIPATSDSPPVDEEIYLRLYMRGKDVTNLLYEMAEEDLEISSQLDEIEREEIEKYKARFA